MLFTGAFFCYFLVVSVLLLFEPDSLPFLRVLTEERAVAVAPADLPFLGAYFTCVTFFEEEIFLTTVTYSVFDAETLLFLTGAAGFVARVGETGLLGFGGSF